MKSDDRKRLVIACDLSALDSAKRARRAALARELHGLRIGIDELPDGYAFRYAADNSTLIKIAEFVSMERLCCPFFEFTIEVASGGESMRLRLAGGEQVKLFLESELGIAK
jgi:hypothetical protein